VDHATPAQGPIAPPRPLPAHLGCDGLRRVRVGAVGTGELADPPGGRNVLTDWTPTKKAVA